MPGASGRRALLAWVGVGLLAAALCPAGAETSIRAELDRGWIQVGDQAVLTVTLEGLSGTGSRPVIPPVAGLEFHEAGRSSNVTWVNGRLSTSTAYTYLVVGRQAGAYRIGPISVEERGTQHQTEVLALEVAAGSPGGTPPGGARAPGTQAPATRPMPGGEAPSPGSEEIFARVDVEPREAFVDQQVTLHFRLYQREDVALLDLGDFAAPSADGFWRESLGAQRDYRVEMNGARYLVREMAWALFPTRSGDLEIGPAQITCYLPERSRRQRGGLSDFFNRGFFDRRPVTLTTPAKSVRVLPLPEAGRPAGFSGSVGEYEISARLDALQAHQGEPFTLQVAVRGRGHIQTIGSPIWPEWDGLRVFDSGEAVSSAPHEDRIEGEKTFAQVLVANRSGRVEIDPIRFAFFDPVQRRYRVVESGPLTVEVAAGSGAGVSGGDADVVALGEDILYIKSDLARGLRRDAGAGLAWPSPVHLIPLALLAGGLHFRRRRLAAVRNPVLVRRSGAYRQACRDLAGLGEVSDAREIAAGLARGFEQYLSSWLDLPVRGTRRSELRGLLREASIAEDLAQRVVETLDWSEEARFGVGAERAEAGARLSAATGLLGELEGAFRGRSKRSAARRRAVAPLLLVVLALGASAAAPASPPAPIVEALQRGERAYAANEYEVALASYREVLQGGWVSPALYYNLGCSAHKAGEVGWAVAYFEEARRLAPRDAEIRRNLKLASARARDRLPEQEGSWVLETLSAVLDGYRPADAVRLLLGIVWVGSLVLAGRWLLSGWARRVAGWALSGVGVLLLAALIGTALKAYQVHSQPSGVVVAEEVGVHAGPRAEETVQFALHAGTLLQVGRSTGAWREVWLSDDMRGWLPANAVAQLRPPRWSP